MSAPDTPSKPIRNVILVTTDQQHFRTLGVTDTPEARTPNIDRLAKQGVFFKSHYVTNPVCSPSRGSFMTGRYPTESGLYANGVALPHDVPTVADAMNRAGFQTGHYGKLHLEGIITRTGPAHPYGFEKCGIGEGDQHLLHDDYNNWFRVNHPQKFPEYSCMLFEGGHMKAYKLDIPEELHLTHWVTDRGMEFMEDRDPDKPFFLNLGFFDPHHAWNPVDPYYSQFEDAEVSPPRWKEGEHDKRPKYYQGFKNGGLVKNKPEQLTAIIRAYHAMMAHIDANIGRLVSKLEELGIADETAILFSSDHGEMLGNHGMLFKGPYMLEDLIHVPMIVSVPGRDLGGQAVTGLTSMVDLFATIQELAGVDDPLPSSGRPFIDRNLQPLPEGGRDYVLLEWEHPSDSGNNSLRCIRTEDTKYVHYNHDPESGELYDLASDPHEFENRFYDAEFAEIRDRMRTLLKEHYGETPLDYRPDLPHPGGW
ncbi:MAG: sulfatase family protein [Opitutales bacterium]